MIYTIDKEIDNTLIIKNSKFITLLIKINDIDLINEKLEQIKKLYPKATHYCYGYIIDNIKKSSDDGEPSSTAGIPILNVLEKEKLTNILVIVVRYFGGIKLGAGGLVRAYTKSVTSALSLTNKVELICGYKIKLTLDYSTQKNIDYILKDSEIIDKNFNENITYTVFINKDTLDKLSNYKYEIIDNCYIEK